eukprot:3488258-Pleurochrysis_carterae.AAC.1
MERAARREKRRREAEERAPKMLEVKRQRQLAAKDAGVIFHEDQHDADGEDGIGGGSKDGERVGDASGDSANACKDCAEETVVFTADGADVFKDDAIDGRAEFSAGDNAG